MSLKFRYKLVDRPSPLPPSFSPMVKLTLKAQRELDVLALLDSGADTTAFSRDIAEIIGADISGEREVVDGIGGHCEAVETKVTIVIMQGHERYYIPVSAKVILGRFEENFPIIIGRQGFFENFDITFKEKERKIILKKI